jgi:hypothetical protein
MRRALTLWPEWAWAVLHLGKRVENRGWSLPVGEWIGLHAGKHVGGRPGKEATAEGLEGLIHMAERAGWVLERQGFTRGAERVEATPGGIVTSAMLGAIRVVGVDPPGSGDLRGFRVPSAFGNRFEFRALARPVPCRGAQGLWSIPADVLAEMRRVGSRP